MSSVYFSTEVCAVPSQNIIPETRTEGSEGMGIDNVNGKQKKKTQTKQKELQSQALKSLKKKQLLPYSLSQRNTAEHLSS